MQKEDSKNLKNFGDKLIRWKIANDFFKLLYKVVSII